MKTTKYNMAQVKAWGQSNRVKEDTDEEVVCKGLEFVKEMYNPQEVPEVMVSTVTSNKDPRRVRFVNFIGEKIYRSEEHTLNSSHQIISYAVFCLKKKKIENNENRITKSNTNTREIRAQKDEE